MVEKVFDSQSEISKTEVARRLDDEIALLERLYHENPDFKTDLGLKVNKLLMDELILQYQISSAQGLEYFSEESLANLEKIYKFYQRIMGQLDFFATQNGVLAEFAVAKAFSKDAGFSAYSATEDDKRNIHEDRNHKLDLWVELENDAKTVLAVQIKCIRGIKEPTFVEIDSPEEFAAFFDRYGYLIKKRGFEGNLEKMRQYSRRYENAVPVLIALPSPGTQDAVFNYKTGLPDKRLGEFLYQEVDKRYLQ